MRRLLIFFVLLMVVSLPACATFPAGPSVMVLPGTNKSFDQFRQDDYFCRQFAYEQVGGVTGKQAAQESAVKSAVVGTALGAVAGAAIGSASGHMGAGMAVGAGSGLIVGSTSGGGYAEGSYYENQRLYDHAYVQCMYAKGNRVPVNGRFISGPSSTRRQAPPASYPPPPPNR